MKTPQIFKTPQEYRETQKKLTVSGKTIGFVPTMGALHEGHGSLLKKSKAECDISVLSIFVNPTQFNNPDDLSKYPQSLDRDLEIARENGVDLVFLPSYESLYPDFFKYEVREKEFSQKLCGASRPGHFEGVLTVVLKLLNIIQPQKVYFGEKDYQQFLLIEEMVRSFFLDMEVIPVPTVRDYDGLALSSRNQRLTPGEREKAPLIYKFLSELKTPEQVQRTLEDSGFQVDYVTDYKERRFVAAHLGNVRLIDNVKI